MALTTLLWSVAAGVLGGISTKLAYVAIRTEWPDAYVYNRSLLEKLSRGSFPKYLLLRSAPLFVFSYLTAAVGSQQELAWFPLGLSIWLTFSALTSLLALLRSWRHLNIRRRFDVPVALGRLLGAAGLVAGGVWAGWIWPALAPTSSGLIEAIWTAVVVTILTLGARKLLEQEHPTAGQKVDLSKSDIGGPLWESMRARAMEQGIEPAIVRAIVVAEALQRPRWIRRLERLLGRWQRSGTYGVAQMRSGRPITDEESVGLLVAELATIYCAGSAGWERFEHYRPFLEGRGATPGYVEEVQELYFHLFDEADLVVTSVEPAPNEAPRCPRMPRLRRLAVRLLMAAVERLVSPYADSGSSSTSGRVPPC